MWLSSNFDVAQWRDLCNGNQPERQMADPHALTLLIVECDSKTKVLMARLADEFGCGRHQCRKKGDKASA